MEQTTTEMLMDWIKHQQETIDQLTELIKKQAESNEKYCHESAERMRLLNEMMCNYIEIQKTHINEYSKHIDQAVEGRINAQKETEDVLKSLAISQAQNNQLIGIIERLQNAPSASISVGQMGK